MMSYDREYARFSAENKTPSKDRQYKKLSGVCAGIARHYDYPRLGVRIVAIAALVLLPIPTGVAYIVASLLMPNRKYD